MRFPKVLAAIEAYTVASEKAESKQWDIGDALLAECGEPGGVVGVNDGSHAKLEAASKEITLKGYEGWEAKNLARLRQVAFDFPRTSRISGISWGVHEDCGTPEFLNTVVEKAKARGKKVVWGFVRAVRDEVHKREVARREAEYKKAQAERKKLEGEEKRAQTMEARREAKARTAAARKVEQAAKAAPAKKRLPPPSDEDIEGAEFWEVIGKFHAAVSKGAESARECQELAKRYMHILTPVKIAGLREHALAAMTAWQATAKLFVVPGRKDHLAKNHLAAVRA